MRREIVPVRPERRRQRRRRRLLIVVLTLVVLLAALYAVLDAVATSVAENQVSSAVVSRTGAASASVQVESFPLLFDVLALGTVSDVHIDLHDVPVDGLTVSNIEVSASSVRIDRGVLLAHRKIRVTSISEADVTANVTAAEIGKAVGHEVLLEGDNTVKVHIGPVFVPATLAITHGHLLTVEEAGIQLLHVNLAVNAIVRSCALHLTVGHETATLSCHIAVVPAPLLSTISSEG